MENNLTELPNRWQIKVTKENQNMVKDFFIKQTHRYRPKGGDLTVWFFSIGYIYGFKDDYYFNGDKLFPFLTDEQFKKWVLKKTIDWIPKFEVGKWYKFKSMYNWYIKLNEISSNSITASEFINIEDGQLKLNGLWNIEYLDSLKLLTDLSEIQEFLPDGHVDKIAKPNTIPEYVECIKKVHDNSSPKVGEIIKANSEGSLIGICSYNSITYKECFKPSTKEAFDKQNEPEIPTKSISINEVANVSLSQFKDFHDYFQPNFQFGTTTSSATTIKPINDQNQLYQDVVIIKKPKKVKQLTIINN
jgi:hypothetical protein